MRLNVRTVPRVSLNCLLLALSRIVIVGCSLVILWIDWCLASILAVEVVVYRVTLWIVVVIIITLEILSLHNANLCLILIQVYIFVVLVDITRQTHNRLKSRLIFKFLHNNRLLRNFGPFLFRFNASSNTTATAASAATKY